MPRSNHHFLHQLVPILTTVLVGGTVACSAPKNPVVPSTSTNETVRDLVLETTTLTVNKMAESEVVIRFAPPDNLAITNLRYRLDSGTWIYMKDPSTGWHIKSDRLSLGDHTVEMRALANGNRPLSGQLILQVVEGNIQDVSWGGGTTSNVILVI